jgi:hypothetical protein
VRIGHLMYYINNILKSTFTTLIAKEPNHIVTRPASFGYRSVSNWYHLRGIIYEIIVINRSLTDTERRNIYNLLCVKWNITQ